MLPHTSWIQTRACSQQFMRTLIIIKRGELTHPSVQSALLHLPAHPNSQCHSFPLFLMGPDSKRVWAVQSLLGWALRYSLGRLRRWSERHPKDEWSCPCSTAPHQPHLLLFLFILLNSPLSSGTIFINSPSGGGGTTSRHRDTESFVHHCR